MQVVLAVASRPPYHEAVMEFAGRFASLMDGKLWVLTLAGGHSTGDVEALSQAEVLSEQAEERADERVEEEVGLDDTEVSPPHRVIQAAGSPVEGALGVLAQCDFGVVGKTLHGEPTGGIAIGGDVADLKQLSTKPLVIVPREVRPVRSALFVYTEHPEAGHALSLAQPLSAKGVAIKLLSLVSPFDRTELHGGGAGYLEAHDVPFDVLKTECTDSGEDSGSAVGEVLSHATQEDVDLVVMGGTHRGLVGRLLWPEMADGVAWNARVPVLIWY